MSAYIRRFLSDPGNDVLLEIESVNILDLEPPTSITGVGAGTVCIVGEFENGPFNTPTEVTSAQDLKKTFGGFGYEYGGVVGNNPCARSRTADSAIVAEYWNGNGVVQLSGKKFKRLVITRVNTSVGSVTLSRCAFLTGIAAYTYNLEPAQTLVIDSGGADLTSTFNATAAVVTGTGGAFGTITAGEYITLAYDAATAFNVVFLAADTTVAAVVARINLYAGFTFATVSTTEVRLTGRQRGTGGKVVITAGSTGALAKCGLTAATTNGTGNVVNIDAVTVAEVNTIVHAVSADVIVTTDSLGRIRMVNTATPLVGTLEIKSGTATDFGFPMATEATAATGTAGTIPAGLRVRTSGGVEWVTMQDVVVTAASAGPYSVYVRPAADDGTGVAATTATVTTVYDAPDIGAYTCTNPTPLTIALTESQIDALYTTAIASTLDVNSVSKEVNMIFSARQSNSVRRNLKQNALDASSTGSYGRVAVIRPPMGTLKSVAQSTSVEPGVGPYRDQRVIYCYPQARTQIPNIATRGTAGGAGFTADGIIDVGADGFMCSILSQLAPEENPGQETPYLGGVLALESSVNATGFTITDYTNFKGKGIAALRISNGQAFFQSGCTSVDPLVHGSLKNISRRRMADYIQDTLSIRLTAFGKKLNTSARRSAIGGEIIAYMDSLGLRIDGYALNLNANTPTTLGLGIFRITLFVRTQSSLDSIVLETTIGESVVLTEAA